MALEAVFLKLNLVPNFLEVRIGNFSILKVKKPFIFLRLLTKITIWYENLLSTPETLSPNQKLSVVQNEAANEEEYHFITLSLSSIVIYFRYAIVNVKSTFNMSDIEFSDISFHENVRKSLPKARQNRL